MYGQILHILSLNSQFEQIRSLTMTRLGIKFRNPNHHKTLNYLKLDESKVYGKLQNSKAN
jgi:hypothetical protein